MNFQDIRQALRAFGNEADLHRRHRHKERPTWWTTEEGDQDEDTEDDYHPDDEAYWTQAEAALWNETAYWQQWGDWSEDPATAYYGLPYDYSEHPPTYPEGEHQEDEAEPTAEEADLLKQEGEAMALAAQANPTLSHARAAVAQVRAARGYYPLGGKQQQPKGRGKGPLKCLLCGQPGHLFRERRFQEASAMFQKGAPKGGFRQKGKQKGKSKGTGRGKAGYYVDPIYYQGHGLYMMEVVRDEPGEYFDNSAPAVDGDLLAQTVRFEPTLRGHLAGNSFGYVLDSFENSVKDPLNENVSLEALRELEASESWEDMSVPSREL